MKIIFLSHTADFGNFKVGSHHLAREFSKMGHEVLHISTPISFPQVITKKSERNRIELSKKDHFIDDFGVIHIVHILPVPLRIASQKMILSKLLKSDGIEDADVVLVDQPLFASVFSKINLKGVLIYRPTDVYDKGIMEIRQRELLQKVDGIIATSNVVLKQLKIEINLPTVVVENGVEFERFYSNNKKVRNGVVYVGSLDSRFDWKSLKIMAEYNPVIPFYIYGPIEMKLPVLPDNVHIMGKIDYKNIPEVLNNSKIGLLPFTKNILNEGRSPMKFYEYLASGLYILASDTQSIQERKAPGVICYNEYYEIENKLDSLLKKEDFNYNGIKFAKLKSWENKTNDILEFIEKNFLNNYS